ncbi:hypothetical protein FRACA_780024 [Frankia canadensis]|uniref:Uncharacterized protein n=1 Tax=Frankia canadensis TaxID=1836972 RepID=A0A2I2L1D0_9ACTN|nr:hypothetical protein FRACA_780024 [Frankia canadensis]SOU58957.1 hypothetical protein FRACA_780024 [Frankia canadensis]
MDNHPARVLTGGTSAADDLDEETAVVGRLILEGVRDIGDDLRTTTRPISLGTTLGKHVPPT